MADTKLETTITVTFAVDHAAIEEGLMPVDWVKREIGWLEDSGISLVEIRGEEPNQYDLERCVCALCDHLDDFEDLDRMSNGDFTEDEQADIWSTFSRDATKEEITAIKSMIFARYCKFIGKG